MNDYHEWLAWIKHLLMFSPLSLFTGLISINCRLFLHYINILWKINIFWQFILIAHCPNFLTEMYASKVCMIPGISHACLKGKYGLLAEFRFEKTMIYWYLIQYSKIFFHQPDPLCHQFCSPVLHSVVPLASFRYNASRLWVQWCTYLRTWWTASLLIMVHDNIRPEISSHLMHKI